MVGENWYRDLLNPLSSSWGNNLDRLDTVIIYEAIGNYCGEKKVVPRGKLLPSLTFLSRGREFLVQINYMEGKYDENPDFRENSR